MRFNSLLSAGLLLNSVYSTPSKQPISKQVKNVLEHQPDSDKYCSVSNSLESTHKSNNTQPSGQIEDACCLYETIEEATDKVYKPLDQLVRTPFFRYFKVDIYEDCPFWYEDTFCMNRDCGVQSEEDEVCETLPAQNTAHITMYSQKYRRNGELMHYQA